MKFSTITAAAALSGLVSAAPLVAVKREVPQEHSHEPFLTIVDQLLQIDNPEGFIAAVFGLLGNAAAADGLKVKGSFANLDCLQQGIADRAFTNAKGKGDIKGMTGALIYRALERNTGQVGLASVLCNQTAVNPEINAIQQHQDPASDNAAAINKGIALELAVQIASIGGDPLEAIKSGTFAPGKIGDPTARGNTCDEADDPNGCIFTQNLLVPDVSEEEINAAVACIKQGGTLNKGDGAAPPPPAKAEDNKGGAAAPPPPPPPPANKGEEEKKKKADQKKKEQEKKKKEQEKKKKEQEKKKGQQQKGKQVQYYW